VHCEAVLTVTSAEGRNASRGGAVGGTCIGYITRWHSGWRCVQVVSRGGVVGGAVYRGAPRGSAVCDTKTSDASTDRQGTLSIDPRAGTNFALGPLSDRILISGVLW